MFYFQLCKLWYHSVRSTSSRSQQRLFRGEVLSLTQENAQNTDILRTCYEPYMYRRNEERRFLSEIQNKASDHIIDDGAAAVSPHKRCAFGGGQPYRGYRSALRVF